MDKTVRKDKIGTGFAKAISVIILIAAATGILILSDFIMSSYIDASARVSIRLVLPWYLLLLILFLSFFNCFDFSGRRYHALLYSCIFSEALACIVVLVLPVIMVGVDLSKKAMLLNGILMCPVLALWMKISRDMFFRLRPISKTLLVTNGNKEKWLIDKINKNTRIFKVEGIASPEDGDIFSVISGYDAVVIGSISAEEKHRIMGICATLEKQVLLRPEYTDIMMINAQTEQFDDLMMIRTTVFGLTTSQRALKRTLDIILSVIAFIIALPIMLVCALAIYIEDGHNPFYKQERLTRKGRPYHVLKLRTMVVNAEELSGPVLAEEDDPRITKVGKFLRKVRLDELPQIINILKGDMSIVGPRPERDFFYDKICSVIPEFRHRLSVKAGLTGMAQVYGRYSTDPYEKLMLDLMYIQNYSIMLDIKLMIETVRVMFEKDAAKGMESDVKKREKQENDE